MSTPESWGDSQIGKFPHPLLNVWDAAELTKFHKPVEQPPSTADYIIYKIGNVIYAKNGRTGTIDFSGTDASDIIQKAINTVTAGKIFIKEGRYTVNSQITLKPGVSLEGVFPKRRNVDPVMPDAGSAEIETGTILIAGTGGLTCFTGNGLTGIELRNLGFKGFKRVIDIGAKDVLGIAFSRFENLYIDNAGDVAINLVNTQHLRISHVMAVIPDGARFLYLANDHYNWSGPCNVFDDLFVVGGKQTDGVMLLEARQNTLNGIEIIRPQINMWDSGGVGCGIKLLNSTGKWYGVSRINIYGADIEGRPHAAIGLYGASGCFISVEYTDADYTVSLNSNGGIGSERSLIIYPENLKIENNSAWENLAISPNISSLVGGIYGISIVPAPIGSGSCLAIFEGNRKSYFTWGYPLYEPEKRRKGTATIPAGGTKVTVSHNLANTPSHVVVTPKNNPGAYFWVSNITSTSFDINISAAQSTNIDFFWEAET